MPINSWRFTAACLTLLVIAAALPQNQALIEAFLNQGANSSIGTASDVGLQAPDTSRTEHSPASNCDGSSVGKLLEASRRQSAPTLSHVADGCQQSVSARHTMPFRNRTANVSSTRYQQQARLLLSQNANSVQKRMPVPPFHLTQTYLASAPANYQLSLSNQYATAANANPDTNPFSGRNILQAFLGGAEQSPSFGEAVMPASSNAQGYLSTALNQASIAISAAESAGSGDNIESRRSAAQSAQYAAQAARSAADSAASAAASCPQDNGYADQARDAAGRAQEAADQASARAESGGW